MAYHSFPWCGDAWLALDILTPSLKRVMSKTSFLSNSFRLFPTFQNNIIQMTEHEFLFSELEGWKDAMTKEQYIELIGQLLERCTDIDTLDLVYRMLAKSI